MTKPTQSRSSQTARRQGILILGMHRSGTSALAGTIRLLGVAPPKTLVPPHASNPRGHWECAPLVELHDRLLAEAGSSHFDWRPIKSSWLRSRAGKKYRSLIKDVISDEFENQALFFIKDPRLCRLVPFTISLMKELEIEPVVLVSMRNPLEVARSLQARDNLPVAQSFLIWLRHVLEAEYHSRLIPRCIIEYEKLLHDWRSTLEGAARKVGVNWPTKESNAGAQVNEFLEHDLRHQNATWKDLQSQPDVSKWVTEAYELLTALAKDDHDKSLLKEIDTLRHNFEEGCQAFGRAQHSYVEQIGSQLLESEQNVRQLSVQVAKRDRQIEVADRDLRRLIGEAEQRDQRLVAADQELRGMAERMDHDLRQLIGEVAKREKQLAAADRELRRLIGEVEQRDQRLVAADQELRGMAERMDHDLRQLIGEVAKREKQLVAADKELRRLIGEVEERDQRLVAADQELRGMTERMDRDLRQLIGEVTEREKQLVTADKELRRLIGDVEQRDQRLVAADQELRGMAERMDHDVRQLIGEVTERDRRLVTADKELRRLIGEAEQRDQRLVAADQELRGMAERMDHDLRQLIGEVTAREKQLVTADKELRRLIGEVEQRDQRLVAADQELRGMAERTDRDLRQLIGEVAAREKQLVTADKELRRLIGEVEQRDQRLVAADQELRGMAERMDLELRQLIGEVTERDRRLEEADNASQELLAELAKYREQFFTIRQRIEIIERSMTWKFISAVQTAFGKERR